MYTGPFNQEQKELGFSIIKFLSTTSLLPQPQSLLSSGIEFYEYRGRVKQNRINKFIESLQNYLETSGLNKKIDFELINEEEFTDLLEAVFLRVSRTKSIEKLDRFKLIIAKSLVASNSLNYLETFLDLIADLHEKEIEILQKHYEIYSELTRESLITENNSIKIQLREEAEKHFKGEANEKKELKQKLSEFEKFRNAKTYKITEGEYNFFIQDLASKSLLVDYGIGAIGVDSYDLMEVTEYGKYFLEFIQSENK